MPALLTRMSIGPISCFDPRDAGANLGAVGDVEGDAVGLAAVGDDCGDDRLDPFAANGR